MDVLPPVSPTVDPALSALLALTAYRCGVQHSGLARLTGNQAWLVASSGSGHLRRSLLPGELVPSEDEPIWIADCQQHAARSAAAWMPGGAGIRFYAAIAVPGHPDVSLFVADPSARTSGADQDLDILKACSLIAGPLLTPSEPSFDAQAALRTHAEHLRRDLDVAQAALGVYALTELDLEPAELMRESMKLVGVHGNLDVCGILILNEHEARLSSVWHVPAATAYAENLPTTFARQDYDWFWQAEWPSASGPTTLDHLLASARHLAPIAPIQGLIAAPLYPQPDEFHLLIGIQLSQRGGWRERDVSLLRVVARVVSLTLERQSQVRALAAGHAELQYTLDHAPLILWRTDAQGMFQSSQGQGLQRLGLPPGVLAGLSALDVYRDAPEVIASLRRALAGDGHMAVSSVAGRDYETHYQPLLGPGGTQTGLMGLSYDVTERVEAERRASALLRISQLLDDTAELADVAGQVLQALSGALPIDWLVLWQRDGAVLRPMAILGEHTPEVARMQRRGVPLTWAQGFGVLDGTAVYAQRSGLPRPLLEAGVQSGAVLPVWTEHPEQVILLGAFCRHDYACTAHQKDLLEVAAQTLRRAVARGVRVNALHNLTLTDPLTGLGNRRALSADMAAELERVQRRGQRLDVLALDLDGFKMVNDQRGHATGDRLLATFGRTLLATLRADDRLYRIGGDEFVVLVAHNVRSPPLAQRLEQVVAIVRASGYPEIGLSWGQASAPEDGLCPNQLLQVSDERLYAHKRSKGRAAFPV